MKCPALVEEWVGTDHVIRCSKQTAKRIGWTCPRLESGWQIHASCFNLVNLLKKSRADVEKLLFGNRQKPIEGDGIEKP